MNSFYQEFCDIIQQNLRTTHNGEEIYLHDVLMDLGFIVHEKQNLPAGTEDEAVRRDRYGVPMGA